VAREPNGQHVDPGIRLVVAELRDLRIQLRDDHQRSDERFEQTLAATREAFKGIHSVGLAIVRKLNEHARLLHSIDRKLSVRGNGGRRNGRRS
jgi:hypothetical protein